MADYFRGYADRMTPAACIPMHTPQEAVDEMDYCVGELGLKAVMMAGHVQRPILICKQRISLAFRTLFSYKD